MSQRATEELVRVVSAALSCNFSAAIFPDCIVKRELKGADTNLFSHNVVVLGASNARNLCAFLERSGLSVLDLSVPGWLASEKSIADLIVKLKNVQLPPGTGIIFDLFGNITNMS
jgi:hypothetical protein